MTKRPLVLGLTRPLNRFVTVPGFRRGVQVVEYVRNGDFANGASQWNGGNKAQLSPDEGRLRITAQENSVPFAYQALALTAGKKYLLKTDIVQAYRTAIRMGTSIGAGNAINSDTLHPRSFSQEFVAPADTMYISILALEMNPGDTAVIDNVSVTEVIA